MADRYGDAQANRLVGTSVNDRLFGRGGDDRLFGYAGNDLLVGGLGADLMQGGAGSDRYSVDSSGDAITELSSLADPGGIDTVISTISYTLGSYVENLDLSGAAALNGTGNGLANRIWGSTGANTLTGLGGDDVLVAGMADDTLAGGSGNDWLYGGLGADLMQGGSGNDSYFVDSLGDSVSELNSGIDAGGIDNVTSTISYTLGALLENLTLSGDGALNGTGNARANLLAGGSGANILLGLDGDDTLRGGGGDDRLSGGSGADALLGSLGTDALDGGTGADAMTGGSGDDTYYVDNAGDMASEVVNGWNTGGIDHVYASVSVTLGAWVEHLTLQSGSHGTGNGRANTILGNNLANVLSGLSGNDHLSGGNGNDTLVGGAGEDVLLGGLDDDALDGGTGADAMTGGSGDDTYYVDNAGDMASEVVNGWNTGGIDHVYASVSVTLGAWVEHLTLQSGSDGTGNGRANTILGNSLANVLSGLSGNDHLSGGNGNDTLVGGTGEDVLLGGLDDDNYSVDSSGDQVIEDSELGGIDSVSSSISYALGDFVENLTLTGAALNGTGNASSNVITGNAQHNLLLGQDGDDRLDGGAGADEMHGGAGSDDYMVDDIGDKVVEIGTDYGPDSVFATVTHTLADDVENLFLMGLEAINGTGNWDDNHIKGNDADNVLDGLGGSDLMEGGDGDDTYYVDDALDVVIEIGSSEGGIDTVCSSTSFSLEETIENLILTGDDISLGLGNSLSNQITGNAGQNHLFGKAGDDTISGGTGQDALDGGAGADRFVLSAPTGDDYDFLMDFTEEDTLAIVGSDYGLSPGALDSGNFAVGPVATAPDGTGQFVFDTASQILSWDSDGSGVQDSVWVASFETAASLDHTDFVVL